MKGNLINDLLTVNNHLIIPNYLIRCFSELELDNYELLMIVYFLNNNDRLSFDPVNISEKLFIEQNKILEIINSLIEKKYISIEMNKTKGIIEEYISLELFYSKISSLLTKVNDTSNKSDIYSKIEKEFGRTLSPIEYETINKWIESNISIELIEESLKEAVLSGVNSIRYIDKILFEWNKKGYKKSSNKEDVIEEIYDYDWLNE